MEKYNKLLRNITKLIEKGLFTSQDLKKELEEALKFKMEIIANNLNLVSREEFEIQKRIIRKLEKQLTSLKKKSESKFYKGKEIFTLSPFMGLLSKEISPPCERIISLAIDNPNPTPDVFCPLLLSIL